MTTAEMKTRDMENSIMPNKAKKCLAETRRQAHPKCFVCSQEPDVLGVKFQQSTAGGVEAVFDCRAQFEGYPDKLHGGIIAALLDGAMTNCIFAVGETALTAEMVVRYKQPVLIGEPAVIRGWIETCSRRLCHTEAALSQGGEVKVTATAKFISTGA